MSTSIAHNFAPPVAVPSSPGIKPIVKNSSKGHAALKAGLLIATLSAIALNGIYQVTKGKTKQNPVNNSKIGYFCKQSIPPEQQGYMGQDIYDPRNPYNNDDPNSPFYHRKGTYGQDIYDRNNPYNKQDPLSPYYDPNYSNC